MSKEITNKEHNFAFREELIHLYMQGWLDRDWKIGEDKAEELAEMYADQIMRKYKIQLKLTNE